MAAHAAVTLPCRLVLLSPRPRQSTELFCKTLALIKVVEDKPHYWQKTAIRPMLAASEHPANVLMSTPYGRHCHFDERWQENDLDWWKHSIKSEDCTRLSETFLEGERRVLSERVYRQEYECAFLEAATAVFPWDLIGRLIDQDYRRDHMPDDDELSRLRTAITPTTKRAKVSGPSDGS